HAHSFAESFTTGKRGHFTPVRRLQTRAATDTMSSLAVDWRASREPDNALEPDSRRLDRLDRDGTTNRASSVDVEEVFLCQALKGSSTSPVLASVTTLTW